MLLNKIKTARILVIMIQNKYLENNYIIFDYKNKKYKNEIIIGKIKNSTADLEKILGYPRKLYNNYQLKMNKSHFTIYKNNTSNEWFLKTNKDNSYNIKKILSFLSEAKQSGNSLRS
jgi:hypothetical protein